MGLTPEDKILVEEYYTNSHNNNSLDRTILDAHHMLHGGRRGK